MTTTDPDTQLAQALLDGTQAAGEWNALYPVGTPVRYWPADLSGVGIPSTTRTRAWVLGHGCPVVSVEGYTGGIALAHVQPVLRDDEE